MSATEAGGDHGRMPAPSPLYRLFENEERTVLVRLWPTDLVEVCRRADSGDLWGAPVTLREVATG